VGIAVAARRRRDHATHDAPRALADVPQEREQRISSSDELMLERSSELSALDGGYDVTATAAPSTIDLR
jgi:hypothetical protein